MLKENQKLYTKRSNKPSVYIVLHGYFKLEELYNQKAVIGWTLGEESIFEEDEFRGMHEKVVSMKEGAVLELERDTLLRFRRVCE